MKRLLWAGLVLALAGSALLFTRPMKRPATDSIDATLADVLGEQLLTWFQDKGQYPPSLDPIWDQASMRAYCAKHDIPPERRSHFRYMAQSDWYELIFTNSGAIQTQMATNGVVIW